MRGALNQSIPERAEGIALLGGDSLTEQLKKTSSRLIAISTYEIQSRPYFI